MLSQDFLDRMKNMLGDEYEDFLECFEKEEYKALRVNTIKLGAKEFIEKSPFEISRVPWCENGFYYDGNKDRPGKHPLHEAGVYYIQEPSAMLPGVIMNARPGERILDLCAAPGGKSTQMAVDMKNEGLIICNEINNARAKILSENIERMGIGNAIVTNETPAKLSEIFVDYFDGIMVDAPCSGEGMFRKNEDAVTEWSPENVEMCAERQDEILDCAAAMVKPGGRIVYSTCTFAPAENEGSIKRFLERHNDFETVDIFENNEKLNDSKELLSVGDMNTIRIWPHKLKGEGHFTALLVRKGFSENEDWDDIRIQKGLKEKECREYIEFRNEYIRKGMPGILIKFGEQLYLLPENSPSISGIKVLRPGLHLGTMKKNRFEPAHALALYLNPGQVKNSVRIPIDNYGENNINVENNMIEKNEAVDMQQGCISKCARAYISGQTFEHEGEKGWYLIETEGFSIGWGKLSAGIMKNHYPKGLRKNGFI